MKHKLAVVLLVLPLVGCGAGSTVDTAFNTLTTTITNPITSVDIYRLENTYAAADQLVADYRSYCWSKPYATLMADPVAKPVCHDRRPVVRAAQSYRAKASFAIGQADAFVKNNPTLNASTVVGAAWSAVTAYQNSIPKVN